MIIRNDLLAQRRCRVCGRDAPDLRPKVREKGVPDSVEEEFEQRLPMSSALLVGETGVDEALDRLVSRTETDIQPVGEFLIARSRLLDQGQTDHQIDGGGR